MSKMISQLKILELASVLAGPSVGQFFAELGAQVLKVENVKSNGDVTRAWLGSGEKVKTPGVSAYFAAVNWGKQSLALDLSAREGREIVYQLIRDVEMVIVSFKPGDEKKLGVDYETLKEMNPGLIYGHITGYGTDNKKTGYDAIIQAEAGFMSMNGMPGGEDLKMPVALIDVLCAHQLKEGLLVALLDKSISGQGKYVHVSLFDSALASLANQATNWLVAGKVPGKMGQEHPNIVPYGKSFITKDGEKILLAIGTDRQFSTLCHIMELGDLGSDSRFMTNQERVIHRNELNDILDSAFIEFESNQLRELFDAHSIPAGTINSLDRTFASKEANEMLLNSLIQDMKGVRHAAFSLNGSRPDNTLSAPPKLGEHTDLILAELGYTPGVITNFRAKGLIA